MPTQQQTRWAAALLLGIGLAGGLRAQTGAQPNTAPAPAAQPAAQTAPQPAAQAPRPTLVGMIGYDHFATDNDRLAHLPGTDRVVLMGDSITAGWKIDPTLFAGDRYVNRGISGQTTPQMLLRFQPDVIALHPGVVAILAGTNDLAGNSGPETVAMIEGFLASMADLAAANHIAVILCSITPADRYPWKPGIAPASDIATINAWAKDYARTHHLVYLDYFGAMAGPGGELPKTLSTDGVHPNAAGYAIMRPLLEQAVAQALRQTRSHTP